MTHSQKVFRQHHVVPVIRTSPIYQQLIAEWVSLNNLASTTRTIRRWEHTEPVLKGMTTPGQIVDTIDASSPVEQDEYLGALLRLFQCGQQLAGRIVMQVMLPKLSRIAVNAIPARGQRFDNFEDGRHETLAAFWQVLANAPVERRPSGIASRLYLDTLHKIVHAKNPRRPNINEDTQVVPFDPRDISVESVNGDSRDDAHHRREQIRDRIQDQLVDDHLIDGPTSKTDLWSLLVWALQTEVVTRDEAQMLLDVYMPHDPETGWGFDYIAERLGIPATTVRQRCVRVIKRLKAAVQEEPAQQSSPRATRRRGKVQEESGGFPAGPRS